MKKIISVLAIMATIGTANAKGTTVMMSGMAMGMAISASQSANQAKNTVGINSLAGKKIENCLVLTAYYNDGLEVVCLNVNKDEIYRVYVSKPKGAFSQGVFDELRKSFEKPKEITNDK